MFWIRINNCTLSTRESQMPLYQFVRDHFYPLISLLSFDCRQICRTGLTCEFYLIFYVLAKDNKPFAIAHVSFISSDQTTLADGDHNLLVYSVSISTDLYALTSRWFQDEFDNIINWIRNGRKKFLKVLFSLCIITKWITIWNRESKN